MKRAIKKLILIWLVLMVVVTGGITFQGYRMYTKAIAGESLETKFQKMEQAEGHTAYEELPEIYIDAVISVEDKRFFQHPGIDVLAIGRAALHNIRQGKLAEGGSTITQQLAKNLYFTQEKSILRKVAELFVTFDLERDYTKKEIFEWYVNTIYFGEGYYGIRSACEGYYGIEPGEMTGEEALTLAGVPNAPSLYNPRANGSLARERMNQVKRAMEN